MLAVKSGHRHEFIKNPSLAPPIGCSISLSDRRHQLQTRRHAHLPHCLLLVYSGSILDEATATVSGANQTRQCAAENSSFATVYSSTSLRVEGIQGGYTVTYTVRDSLGATSTGTLSVNTTGTCF